MKHHRFGAQLSGACVGFVVAIATALLAAETSKPVKLSAEPKTPTSQIAPSEVGAPPHVLPGRFALTGPAARQPLLVEFRRGDDFVGEATSDIKWTSSNPQIVKVENGAALPVGNGAAVLTAKLGDQTATADVTVAAQDHPQPVSFRNEVQSVLAKVGCNSGACHGAAAGKNGFKLSLRGYDADADFFTLTRQDRGRRITPSDPARSLMLLKPTGVLPHKGGVRLEVGSADYNTIVNWIAAGAPAPQADDPRMQRLEILPDHVMLQPGQTQRFLVRAHYTDGHSRDVTHWVKFTSSDESVAQVDQEGNVRIMGVGEGVISCWFASRIKVATVTVPATQKMSPAAMAEALAKSPRRNFIDEMVLAKLARLHFLPSPRAADGVFLRRAYLDTIGMLPTADETRAFLADRDPAKRDKLIDRLLERPEFVDYWSYKWSDLLLVSSEKLPEEAVWSYYNWIRSQVSQNVPWDQFARKVVTAAGDTLENGAANFFVLHQDPKELAETTSQAFLGMSINCARCHNHPLEKWTNDQYYGMANLYARVKLKNGDARGEWTVFSVPDGDLIQPRTGHPQPPRPLDAEPVADGPAVDRRAVLADWLTSPENPYFGRAICNRVWANFMGVGLVEAVDDVRLTNPPSNDELLSALAKFLVENHYDLKSLMRVIMQSEAYQRSSEPLPGSEADRRFYARFYPRRLKAEVLLDALSQVTGSPTAFKGFAPGWRAEQLPDSNVESYFLKSFGRPVRQLTCECERTGQPSIVQVLHLSNGETLNPKLADKKNRLSQMLAANTPTGQIVEKAYLSALCRPPTAEEKDNIVKLLDATPAGEKRQAVEDFYWGLLSSTEFLFDH